MSNSINGLIRNLNPVSNLNFPLIWKDSAKQLE